MDEGIIAWGCCAAFALASSSAVFARSGGAGCGGSGGPEEVSKRLFRLFHFLMETTSQDMNSFVFMRNASGCLEKRKKKEEKKKSASVGHPVSAKEQGLPKNFGIVAVGSNLRSSLQAARFSYPKRV